MLENSRRTPIGVSTDPLRGVAALFATLSLGLLASCARPIERVAFEAELLSAERRLSEGPRDEAERRFRKLARRARGDEERTEMLLRAAEARRRVGTPDAISDARRELEALMEEASRKVLDVELRAKIAYAIARVSLDLGDETRGRRELVELLDSFPSTAYAARALQLYGARLKEQDARAWADFCEVRYQREPKSALADQYAWESGRIYFERETAEDDVIAERAFKRVLTGWTIRTSGFWDDALWDLSIIYHRRRRFADERALLEAFIAERVEASAPGSYEHVNFKFAWMRIGKLLLDDLGQPADAARWFQEFPSVFKWARIRDEARYWEIRAWERAGEPERAAAAQKQLAADFPESRWLVRLASGDQS